MSPTEIIEAARARWPDATWLRVFTPRIETEWLNGQEKSAPDVESGCDEYYVQAWGVSRKRWELLFEAFAPTLDALYEKVTKT